MNKIIKHWQNKVFASQQTKQAYYKFNDYRLQSTARNLEDAFPRCHYKIPLHVLGYIRLHFYIPSKLYNYNAQCRMSSGVFTFAQKMTIFATYYCLLFSLCCPLQSNMTFTGQSSLCAKEIDNILIWKKCLDMTVICGSVCSLERRS